MPPVVVSGRHRPHEVMFLAYSALLGLALIVGAQPPGSIEQLMPGWFRWAWYVLLASSGVVGAASFVIRDLYTQLTLERTAMVGQVAAYGLYAMGIFTLGGWRGLAAGGLCLALVGASAWRFWQVTWEIRAVRSAAGE